jgi:hypothetical protein
MQGMERRVSGNFLLFQVGLHLGCEPKENHEKLNGFLVSYSELKQMGRPYTKNSG